MLHADVKTREMEAKKNRYVGVQSVGGRSSLSSARNQDGSKSSQMGGNREIIRLSRSMTTVFSFGRLGAVCQFAFANFWAVGTESGVCLCLKRRFQSDIFCELVNLEYNVLLCVDLMGLVLDWPDLK